jgi:tRNA modification GTPase
VKHSLDDTITAIVTPLGAGGLGVIRISGANALRIAQKLSSKRLTGKPNHIMPTWIKVKGAPVDQAMVSYLKAPNSFTGEDTIEISLHGSMASLRRVLAEIVRLGGRLAGPGEFTKRAFLNGKIDLSQAEAVIDLIEAKSNRALKNAAQQLEGWLGREVARIREELVSLLVRVEGAIDFPDDLTINKQRLGSEVVKRGREIARLLATADEGRVVREGLRVAIVGRPNVGKSSLLNALVKAERAIVSCEPGTTRDTIEEELRLGGGVVVLVDTAGIRRVGRGVEREGVRRAEQELDLAELVLLVIEAPKGLVGQEKALLKRLKRRPLIIVRNKVDLGDAGRVSGNYPQCKISALTGDGLAGVIKMVRSALGRRVGERAGVKVLINERHKECLTRARESLIRGLGALRRADSAELVAEDLKQAVVALGEINGQEVSSQVIDQIFSRFCVGK